MIIPYKLKTQKDLFGELKKAFSGDLEETILALMQTPPQYDASQLKKAMAVSIFYFQALFFTPTHQFLS